MGGGLGRKGWVGLTYSIKVLIFILAILAIPRFRILPRGLVHTGGGGDDLFPLHLRRPPHILLFLRLGGFFFLDMYESLLSLPSRLSRQRDMLFRSRGTQGFRVFVHSSRGGRNVRPAVLFQDFSLQAVYFLTRAGFGARLSGRGGYHLRSNGRCDV